MRTCRRRRRAGGQAGRHAGTQARSVRRAAPSRGAEGDRRRRLRRRRVRYEGDERERDAVVCRDETAEHVSAAAGEEVSSTIAPSSRPLERTRSSSARTAAFVRNTYVRTPDARGRSRAYAEKPNARLFLGRSSSSERCFLSGQAHACCGRARRPQSRRGGARAFGRPGRPRGRARPPAIGFESARPHADTGVTRAHDRQYRRVGVDTTARSRPGAAAGRAPDATCA